MAGGYGTADGVKVNVPAPDEGLSEAAKVLIAQSWAMDAESGAELAAEVRDRVRAMRDKDLRARIHAVLERLDDVLTGEIDREAARVLVDLRRKLAEAVGDYGIADVVKAGQLLAATQTERARAFPFVRTVANDEQQRASLGRTETNVLAEALAAIEDHAPAAEPPVDDDEVL